MRTRPFLALTLILLAGTGPLAAQDIPEGTMIIEEDILVPDNFYELPESLHSGFSWTGGIVSYQFDSAVTAANRANMREAMNEIEAVSAVRFQEVSWTPGTILIIQNTGGSASYSSIIGMLCCSGPFGTMLSQVVAMTAGGWANKFTICHELIHALGCWHEQSRPDRGSYIQINWGNIQSGQSSQFDTHSGTMYGPYDFDSVMHYGQFAFSICNQPGGPPCGPATQTITCLPPYQAFQNQIGQRQHLSTQDAVALISRYGVPSAPAITSVPQLYVPAGAGNVTLTVNGSGFFKGSNDGGGVAGSWVQWNGTALPTTYVSPSQLTAVLGDDLLRQPGTYQVRVNNNPSPFGGLSNVVNFQVSERFRKVMLTEVSWGDVDGAEICNFDTVPHNITSWRIRWNDGAVTESFALVDITIQPGEIIVFTEPSATPVPELPGVVRRFSMPAPATSSQAFSVALVSGSGIVMDEVRITNTAGTLTGPDLGGAFRGRAFRGAITGTGGAVGVERMWGLDSDGGADWTEQPDRSFGLENRNSGLRGTDLAPGFLGFANPVRLNEIDDSPDLVEIRHAGSLGVDLKDWFLVCSAQQNQAPTIVRPWPSSVALAPGGFAVIGEGPAPAELPGGVPYSDVLALGFNMPFTQEEYSVALYDSQGTLWDVMRTTGHDDAVVHNHPRMPSAWSDFTGAAGRNNNTGDAAIGRDAAGFDSNRGSDWRPVQVRTMGSHNGGFAGAAGLGDALDVRINDTGIGGGVALIANAGTALAGKRFNLLSSYTHLNGQGPLLGLGFDALYNWATYGAYEPWGAMLDARGSYRFDIAPDSLPSFVGDHIALLTDPGTGAYLAMTRVVEEDH